MRVALLFTFLLLSLGLSAANIKVELTVTATSTSSLFLKWTPTDPGSISFYEIHYNKSTDTKSSWVTLYPPTVNYTISKLDADTEYYVSFQAFGLLEAGTAISKIYKTCPGVPGPVSQIRLLKAMQNSVQFAWENPTQYFGTANTTIIDYWTPNGPNKIVTVDASAKNHTLDHLNATLPFYVNLAASTKADENSCGGGRGVGILGGLFYTISDAEFTPVGGTLRVTGPTSLRREWEAQNLSDPRILALTYLVTGGTRGPQAGILPMTARGLSINNLEPNTKYTVDIIVSGVYTRTGSPLEATTAPGMPGMPTGLTVTKQGNNALRVQWSAPANLPGTLKEYACSLYSGDTLVKTEYEPGTEHKFTELSTEGVYKVTVAASIAPNEDGLGGGSGPAAESDVIPMKDFSKPALGPPTNLKVAPAGIDSISVKWDPPAQDTVGVYGYNINFKDTKEQIISRFVPSNLNFYIMTGLKSNELYKVSMKSIGLLYDSVLTEEIPVTTKVAPPSPPQNVRATMVLSNTAEITWSAPAQFAETVTAYVVEALQGGTVLGTQKVPAEAPLRAAFVLPSYAEVSFSVAAESAVGVGASASSNVVFSQDFAFLEDKEMNQWINQTRFMIILRGPAGPGKDAVVQSIRSHFLSTKLCSESASSPKAVDELACLKNVKAFVEAGYGPILVDSLVENATDWRGKPYVDLAMANDYNVLLVVAQTPGFIAPQVHTLLHRGAQDLPAGLEEKLPSLAPVYPLYYGWFWPSRRNCNDKPCSDDLWAVDPSKETYDLVTTSRKAFEAILKDNGLRATLAKTCGLSASASSEQVSDFWKSAVNPLFGQPPPANEGYPAPTRPHVTSYYSNYGAQPGAKEYADLLIVNEALLGRVDTLSVLGLMVSKRTIGARLKLESAMLPFWRQDDSAPVEGSLGGDRPSRPAGSRAHATLALAKGVGAVETGFDTMRVFDAEARGYPDTKRTEVADGIIYDITMPSKGTGEPEHIFYYEFKTPLTPRVMYTSFY